MDEFKNNFYGLIGQTPIMQNLFASITTAAKTNYTVLIQGESGSGKELVARATHQLSSRKNGSYIILNCAAISPHLMESELFGHEKGAFTGAYTSHKGAFEQAHNGTLFLDEIGDLPIDLQPKLLRVLENKLVRKVGGKTDIPVNVRIVAATHHHLPEKVRKKEFRLDLFYRLHVVLINVPPLRERKEDIPLLTDYFLKKEPGGANKKISEKAMMKLLHHSWPGNIRELRHVLLNSLLACKGHLIEATHIPFINEDMGLKNFLTKPDEINLSLQSREYDTIREALIAANGNKQKAALLLGIAKSTLFKRISDALNQNRCLQEN